MLVLLLAMVMPVTAIELENIKLDETIQIGKYSLMLNGAGIRKKFTFKGFVGALYLEKKANTEEAVLAEPGAKRMLYIMLRDVSGQTMMDKINEAIIANNTMEDMKLLEIRFEQMEKIFSEMKELKYGDSITMDYIPGAGTRISLNGVAKGTITGEDFYRSLLKNWIGNRPVQSSLKKSVLGIE